MIDLHVCHERYRAPCFRTVEGGNEGFLSFFLGTPYMSTDPNEGHSYRGRNPRPLCINAPQLRTATARFWRSKHHLALLAEFSCAVTCIWLVHHESLVSSRLCCSVCHEALILEQRKGHGRPSPEVLHMWQTCSTLATCDIWLERVRMKHFDTLNVPY